MKLRPVVVFTALAALIVGVTGGVLVQREARWRSATYCIERVGQLWAGEAGAVPVGYAARCPESDSYRAEVRRGTTRIEQYVTSGWRPRDLADRFRAAGFVQRGGDFLNDGRTYEAFLQKPGGPQLYYLASRQDGTTVVTLNGHR